MTDILPFLEKLLSSSGLSGYEDPVAALIAEEWRPLCQETSRDNLGSVRAVQRGSMDPPRRSVMMAAHMDAVGLMVTGITDGFLRVTSIGGVDARVLPGTPVKVYARETLPGVVVQPSPRLLPAELTDSPVPLNHLFVDVGLPPRRVEALVQVGDVIAFATWPVELPGEALSGHSLDNRASVAALTVCLQELQDRPHAWDLWAVASSQEEVPGMGGAGSSTFELRPSLAIAVDVTFARSPGSSDWNTIPIGKGPTLVIGPNIHPAVFKAVKELAEGLEIPFSLEYAPRHTGTDAFTIQVIAEGIPTLVMGIPLRYMHTPVEMVLLKDIRRTGHLLAEFTASLSPEFMTRLVWEN
jgi:endoglucanase